MSDVSDLKIHLAFDAEADVWYVAQSDVPGLRLEAGDPMELIRRIAENVADLIELNQIELRERADRPRQAVHFTPIFDSAVPASAHA